MSYSISRDANRVVATFEGMLTSQEGLTSATEFAQAIGEDEITAVFDITAMTSYAPGARHAWQRTLWPVRKRIGQIILVGGGPLIRVGGMLLASALGIKLVKAESLAALP